MAEIYVDGEWRRSHAGGRREIRCPADGSLVAEIDEAGPEDTIDAIEAAHRAFHSGPWPHVPARERGDLLLRVADLLVRDRAAIARAESLDTGTTGPHAPYMLIVCALAEKIRSGELKPGDRVPGVTELVEIYNVSPSTARRALAKLKEMGLTDTVPGYATFVRFCR